MSDACRALRLLIVPLGLIAVALGCVHTRANVQTDPIVQTQAGAVMGHARGDIIAFLGIPYAEPPVGPLRWRLPLPHAPWTGTFNAGRFGSICPQPVTAAGQPTSSEDCLFLNVYVPRSPRPAPRPVMVWIHGGINTTGAGSFYDPTPLVETGDVIVVTMNYRLGALGFLAHPALQAEAGTTGNYGLADQQLVLRWVRANIAGFGGDPANVTLFGESSGGMNVLSQIVSPLAAELFDRAIVESGTFLLETSPLANSEARGRTFASRIGCIDQSAACLRAQSVADVLANQGNPNSEAVTYELATVDGTILPVSQRAALATGTIHRVPVLMGNNGQEGRMFVPSTLSRADYPSTLAHYATAAHRPVAGVIETYPLAAYASPTAGASAAFGDSTFACTDRVVERLLGGLVPTYAYEFDDTAAGTASLGPTHGSELKYLFGVSFMGSVLDGDPASLPGPSRDLARTMQRFWTSFARSGDPQRPGLPEWPTVPSETIQRLVAPLPGAVHKDTFDVQHKCLYWNSATAEARGSQPR